MPSGAELFAQSMVQLGIRDLFTLVGDHLNEALLAVSQAGIRIVDMRHESGVTHCADAWARIHRRPAVSLVTGGPGHTNSLTGIATANLTGSPLIAVSGSPSLALSGRQVFQVIDQVSMTQPAVKWSAGATGAAEIPYLMGRAYNEANSGRKGAVHLTIPVNVFAAQTESALPMPAPLAGAEAAPAVGQVETALGMLFAAKRPIVVAGSGVWWGEAEAELAQFLRKTKLPLFTVTLARGVVADTRANVFGYADPAINKAALAAFQEADVVLVLGKRLDYRLALGGPRLFGKNAKVIQVDLHAPELGAARSIDLGICADVKATLRAMTKLAGEKTWQKLGDWTRKLSRDRRVYQATLDATATKPQRPMHPAALFSELRKALPADTLYSWDGGDFVHWGRAMIPATQCGGWLRLGPMGTIGSALPNCIALQLANPGKPVVMITGDGSLGFYLAELETLVRYGLPVVIIVGNDGGWGLERELQMELTGGKTVACELKHTRYDLIMQGFGGGGETVEKASEVAAALKRAFASGKPYLLNAIVKGARSPFTEWQIAGKKK
ncbi:MAG: thiamine pyrophosphate-binding protein [Candidatus Solibacter usitatus]|nr:thiamine pyrophosphate-binding protein [Candidatus Solibacter usitatus]